MFSRSMSLARYRQLTADAKVLEAQSFGVKVWLLPDGRIMKLFRLKGFFSSGRRYPYNLRFARNARRLQAGTWLHRRYGKCFTARRSGATA